MATPLIPLKRDRYSLCTIEDDILYHMIKRQTAGQAVPAYVIHDLDFVDMVRRVRLAVQRDEAGAFVELDWPTKVMVRAGGVDIGEGTVKLEER